MPRKWRAAEPRRRYAASLGNAGYEYFQPLDDADTVLLIDSWTDQTALDAHHASPEMQTIMRLREKYGLTVKAERFTSESVPERDKEFLK